MSAHTHCDNIRDLITSNLSGILERRNLRVKKADDSYVTEGDLLVQDLVYEYLSRECPQHQVVSEEMDNSNFTENDLGNYAVLDPVDGTENFTSGLVEWGVGLSIYTDGVHDCSMILLPEMDRSLLTGDKFERFQSRIHGVSSSLKVDDLTFIEPGFEYRMMGCSMYNMYNAVRGSYAVYENVKGVNTWDILPGVNLALEHGCHVQLDGEDYDGRFLPPIKKYRVKLRRQ